MQPQICLETYHPREGHKKQILNLEQLIELVTNGRRDLEEMLQYNTNLISIPQDTWNGQSALLLYENVEWKCGGMNITHIPAGASAQSYTNLLDWTNQGLPGIIRQQEAVEQEVKRGNFTNQVFIDGFDGSRPYNQLTIARVFDGLPCPDCGHIQSLASIKSHQQSLKCMQASHDRDLREAGWKMIEQSHHGTAVRKAGIEWDVRASEYKMWIPPWVDAAIKQYETDERNRYGGLKLEEFLTKMKPNGNE